MSSMKFRLVSGASTNLTKVKGDPGDLTAYVIVNANAAARFVKFYDSTDQPTVGTTVPALTVQVPASSQVALAFSSGLNFKQTMWVATTTGVADSDTGAVGAGDLLVQLGVE